MRSAKLFILTLVILICGFSAASAEDLAYYSDYFSFVGQDESGYVLFALDNNRGVDKDKFQAEHFGVLYDQFQGWINLVGTGEYENSSQELKTIPNSAMFKFATSSDGGLVVNSRANDLSLRIKPIAIRMREDRKDQKQDWGTAAAILSWQGRNIPGRVIHEHLEHQNWNRLTRSYSDTWDNFQGFYLSVQSGPAASWQDIYLRSEGIKNRQRTRGFIDAGRRQANLISPDLNVTEKSTALGFYRWNEAWEMNLQQVQGDGQVFPPFARLELKKVSRNNIRNWVIGGFSMSVIEGAMEVNGQKIPVLGFAEMIK